MAPSCRKQQLQTLDLEKKMSDSLTLDSCLWCSTESVSENFKVQFHVVVLTQTGSPDRITRETRLQFLSILVTFKAMLTCRHKAGGGGNEGSMPYLSVFF